MHDAPKRPWHFSPVGRTENIIAVVSTTIVVEWGEVMDFRLFRATLLVLSSLSHVTSAALRALMCRPLCGPYGPSCRPALRARASRDRSGIFLAAHAPFLELLTELGKLAPLAFTSQSCERAGACERTIPYKFVRHVDQDQNCDFFLCTATKDDDCAFG